MNVSAVLITRNAERTLDRTLASLGWVDEVVVVDSGSEDATEEIARRHGARFLTREWPGYGPQRQWAARASRGDWILCVDGDEEVSPALAASVRGALRDPKGYAGFKMFLYTEFLGRWLGSRGWWRCWKLRLFRKDRSELNDEQIHEGVTVDGSLGYLEGPLYHRPWRDLDHRLTKENLYSTLSAVRDYRRGRRSGPLRPFVRGLGWFVKEYLLRCGFLHGGPGLLHAGLSGAYAFQRAAKLHELTVRGGPVRGTAGWSTPRSLEDDLAVKGTDET